MLLMERIYNDSYSATHFQLLATNGFQIDASSKRLGFDEQYGAADIGVVSNYMTNNNLTAMKL